MTTKLISRFFISFLVGLFCLLSVSCHRTTKHTIQIKVIPHEAGMVDQPEILYLKHGSNLTIHATPNGGFKLISWSANDEARIASEPIVLNNIIADQYIEIKFAPIHIIPTPENSGIFLSYTRNSNAKGFNMTFYNNFQSEENPCDKNVSITVDADGSETFVPNNTEIERFPTESERYKNQYSCTLSPDKHIISLGTNFRPIAKKFTIKILDTLFKIQVVSKINDDDKLSLTNSPSPYIPENFHGCGEHGTIVQRMFDCSMLVDQNHFNYSNPNDFTKTSVDNFASDWFLVHCPAGKLEEPGILKSKCSWLTPVITHEKLTKIPNLKGEPLKINDFKNSYRSNTRILFSPILTNHKNKKIFFTYEEGLGPNLWSDFTAPYTGGSGDLSIVCRGTCYAGRTTHPSDPNNQNFALTWHGLNDEKVIEDSACVTIPSHDILPNYNSNLFWKLPIYPMLEVISRDYGFKAINTPNFFAPNDDHYFNSLLSSSYVRVSLMNVYRPIYFNSSTGNPYFVLLDDLQALKMHRPLTVRCASINWN